MSKKKKTTLPFIAMLLIAIIIFIITFNLFTYTTAENEYSVVKQFGRIVDYNETPGLRVQIPFIQNVNYISKALRLYDLNQSEVITADKKTMIVDAYVLWEVTDAKLYTSTLNASDNTARSRLDVIVYNAIKTTISSMTQEEVIVSRNGSMDIKAVDAELNDLDINNIVNNNDNNVKSVTISERLLACVGNQCDQYGIKIADIEIKILDLPNENKEAVYQRMITERNNIATAYTAQGQSEAQIIRNTTDAEVAVILSEAKANAEATIAEGEAEYMRILADAYNDGDKAEFYLFSLELDSLKKSINSSNTTIFIDKDNPIAEIFNGIN